LHLLLLLEVLELGLGVGPVGRGASGRREGNREERRGEGEKVGQRRTARGGERARQTRLQPSCGERREWLKRHVGMCIAPHTRIMINSLDRGVVLLAIPVGRVVSRRELLEAAEDQLVA